MSASVDSSMSASVDSKSDQKPTTPMRYWGGFDGAGNKLWHRDYDLGMVLGVGAKMGQGMSFQSKLDVDTWSSMTRFLYKDPKCETKTELGVNVHSSNEVPRPSAYLMMTVPFANGSNESGSITARMHKTPWRALPYFGLDFKSRTQHVAVTTSIGQNPGKRMDQTGEQQLLNDFGVAHSVSTGSGPFAVGGSVKWSLPLMGAPTSLTDYNVGVDYKQDKYGMSVVTKDKTHVVNGSVWRDVCKNVRLGSRFQYDRVLDAAKSGVALELHSDNLAQRIKVKADTTGFAGVSLFGGRDRDHEMVQGHMNLSGNFKTQTINQFGAGLSFGDY